MYVTRYSRAYGSYIYVSYIYSYCVKMFNVDAANAQISVLIVLRFSVESHRSWHSFRYIYIYIHVFVSS